MTTTAAGPPRDAFGWAGSVLENKYRIDAVVGEGGFGVVYAGHHLGFDNPIAVKFLKLDSSVAMTQRDSFLRNFASEGQILYRLSGLDPAIVRALDVGAAVSPSGVWTPYLVLEWIRGKTLERDLEERIARGAGGRALDEAHALLDPVARALDVAHGELIVHRDIKPGNLLLTDVRGAQTIKVLDFGVAKVMSELSRAGSAVTVAGFRAFSPAYGAPEQFERSLGATGPWTDVFALALVFVEVATGRRALPEGDVTKQYVASMNPDVRPTIRGVGGSCTNDVERVLRVALAVDPRNRYARAGEFWRELRAAVGRDVPRALGAGVVRTVTDPGVGQSVRTEIPDAPLLYANVAPTAFQPPDPRVSAPGATSRRASGSGRRLLWAVVPFALVVGVFVALRSGIIDTRDRSSGLPRIPIASAISPTATGDVVAPASAVTSVCCGGARCLRPTLNPAERQTVGCGAGVGSCACPSGVELVDGACHETSWGPTFEVSLGKVVDSSDPGPDDTACRTPLVGGTVCLRPMGDPVWNCAPIRGSCASDGSTFVGGGRFGTRPLVLPIEAMWPKAPNRPSTVGVGLEIRVEDSTGADVAHWYGAQQERGFYRIAECEGLTFKSPLGGRIRAVTLYVRLRK